MFLANIDMMRPILSHSSAAMCAEQLTDTQALCLILTLILLVHPQIIRMEEIMIFPLSGPEQHDNASK